MAATVELDESNGATETVTHDPANFNYGAVDATALNPTANPIVPGDNSFEKWRRYHVTAMGGSAAVQNLKFFATAPAANTTHNFNGHTTQATYDGANHKQTAFAQPATSATRTPEAVPTSAPGSANLGIGGSLTGQFTATGWSDYLLTQIRTTGAAVSGTTLTETCRYDDIA